MNMHDALKKFKQSILKKVLGNLESIKKMYESFYFVLEVEFM